MEAFAVDGNRDESRDRAAARLDAFDGVGWTHDLRNVERPHVVEPFVGETALDDHAAFLDILHDRARVAALGDRVCRALVQCHVLPRFTFHEVEQHVVRVLALLAFLRLVELEFRAAEDEKSPVGDSFNHERGVQVLRHLRAGFDLEPLAFLGVEDVHVRKHDFVVPATLDHDAFAVVHQVSCVRAAFRQFAAGRDHFLLLFGLGVEDPRLVEVLACLERASVAADELHLAVHEGCSMPATWRRTRTFFRRLEVVEVVVGFG